MKETTVRFKMNDGASAYTFRPALTPEQYAELQALARQAHSIAELVKALEAFAIQRQLLLAIDEP